MVHEISSGPKISSKERFSFHSSQPEGDKNFMEVLRQKFDEVKSKLQDVPGLPGVYTLGLDKPQNFLV
jgi:hypothetical protein